MTILFKKNLHDQDQCIYCSPYLQDYIEDIEALNQVFEAFDKGHSVLDVIDWLVDVDLMIEVEPHAEPASFLLFPKRKGQKLAQWFFYHPDGSWHLEHYTFYSQQENKQDNWCYRREDITYIDDYRGINSKVLKRGVKYAEEEKSIPGGWIDRSSVRYKWKFPGG